MNRLLYFIPLALFAVIASFPITDACAFDLTADVHIYDFNATQFYQMDLVQKTMLSLIDGESFWRGYDAPNPFDVPNDLRMRFQVNWGTSGYWLIDESPTFPGVLYLWLFDNLRAYADSNGNHYGVHPCAVLTVDESAVTWIVEEARNASDS